MNQLYVRHQTVAIKNLVEAARQFLVTATILVSAYFPAVAQDQTCNAAFTYTIDGSTVKFLPVATDAPRQLWYFGDGGVSDDITPAHSYGTGGTYTILHIVRDSAADCVDSVIKVITLSNVNCTVEPRFEWYDSTHCKQIRFVNQSVPLSPNVHFAWKFGDGTTSTDISPVHTFPERGIYNVCLVIEVVGSDCRREICKAVEVTCDSCNLQADFTYETDAFHANLIHFKSIVNTSGTPQYKWSFGDGSYADDATVAHTYSAGGSYVVCLRVAIANTCVREICKTIVVKGDSCVLKAKFEYKVDSGNKSKVFFINQSASNADGVHYVWKFGDGSASNDLNPIHVYDRGGQYQVCLVAETDRCRSEYCLPVTIVRIDSPECDVRARFEWLADEHNPNKIWFQNVSEPVSHIWRTSWDYGDGTESHDFNTFHEYSSTGRYKVCLHVLSLSGCSRTFCDSVTAGTRNDDCGLATLTFEYKRNAERSNDIGFHAVSEWDIKSQRWVIERDSAINGSPYRVVIEQANPSYIFPFVGSYTVCVQVVYNNGCTKQYCERLSIGEVVNGAVPSISVPLYPNPARSMVRLELRLERAEPVRVSVLDVAGSEKLRIYVKGQAGNNTIMIPVSKLSQGQYLVRLVFADQVRVAKFQRM